MGGLGLIAQPFVIALSMGLWIFDNGQTVLNADGIAQMPDCLCTAPEVSELSVTIQVDGTPNDVIMDMGFVDVGTDNKGMFAFGEAFGKVNAQFVGFLRRNLTGTEGLTDVIGNYIVFSTHPSGSSNILPLCQEKLGIGYPAVTFIAGDESAVIGFLRIGHIVDDIADGPALSPALAGMQGHDPCGCHDNNTSNQKGSVAK